MKRLLSLVAFFATLHTSAQQVNPVPDYVFRNQMSVGRGTVTDTAAYFSIGPRYGANKGFMPPIVVDTAIFSSGKRNGLLIFSVQKNKFLYWDSVRVQWSDMAGSSGSYIVAGDTASMLSPYVRHAGYGLTKSGQSFLVDTLNIATRAWRQKGIDSALSASVLLTTNQTVNGNKTFSNDITFNGTTYNRVMSVLNISAPAYNHIIYSKANAVNQFLFYPADTGTLITDKTLQSFVSGTTNYVAKFTAGSTIGNSQIFDNGTSVGIGTASPNASYLVEAVKNGDVIFNLRTTSTTGNSYIRTQSTTTNLYSAGITQSTGTSAPFVNDGAFNYTNGAGGMQIITGTATPIQFFTNNTERLRITSGGNVGVGTTNPVQKFVVSNSGSEGFEFVPGASSNSNQLLSYNRGTSAYSDLVTRAATYNIQIGTTNAAYIFANGRVGINTTTDAGYQFDVNGSIRATSTIRSDGNFYNESANPAYSARLNTADGQRINMEIIGTDGRIQVTRNSGAQPNLIFSTEGGEKMRITAAGNVGINQNSPSYLLDINGTLRSVNGANFATTSGNVGIGTASPSAKFDVDGVARITGSGSAPSTGEGIEFQYAANQGEVLTYNRTGAAYTPLRVRSSTIKLYGGGGAGGIDIATSGNVGIGTASPTTYAGYTTLAVNNATNGGVIDVMRNNSVILQIFGDAGASGIGSLANVPFTFKTNSIEQGRINTAGEFLLNSTNSDAGDYKLQVSGNIYNTGSAVLAATSGEAYIGTTSDAGNYKLQVSGQAFIRNTATSGALYLDSTSLSIYEVKNRHAILISGHSLTGAEIQGPIYVGTNWNTSSDVSAIEVALTNTASGANSNLIKLSDGTNTFRVTKDAGIFTADPSGGTARKWKFGSAATVSPTSPNRTIQIEVDGVVYYLHAKTTND